MAIKTYKPTSPARRFNTTASFDEITKKTPEKSLLAEKKKNAGRNNQGRITVRHRGGGNRVKYRIIDFKRNKDGIPAKVVGIEYDPNRSAYIALLNYADGEKRYILAPLGLNVGDTVMSGANADIIYAGIARKSSERLFITPRISYIATAESAASAMGNIIYCENTSIGIANSKITSVVMNLCFIVFPLQKSPSKCTE